MPDTTMDHRPVIDQWTDSVLDVIKDDLVYDSREEVKGILLDFKKSVRRVCSAELARAVVEERARIANIIDGTKCDMCGQENTMWNCLTDRMEVCNGAKHELLRNLKEK